MSKKSKGFNLFDFSYLKPKGYEKKAFNTIISIIKRFFIQTFKSSPLFVTVLLRHKFGIDYLSLNKLIIANVIVWIFTALPSTYFNSASENINSSPLSFIVASIITIMSVIHYLESSKDFKQNQPRHSHDSGESLIAKYLKINEQTAKTIIEPIICFVAGILIYSLGSIHGALIILGGFVAAYNDRQIYNQQLSTFKKIKNAQHSGQAMRQMGKQSYAAWSNQKPQTQPTNNSNKPQNIKARVAVKRKRKP